jgi:hypothetical protein
MLVNQYFGIGQDHPRQPRMGPDVVSTDDAFAYKLFPVRPMPYLLIVSILVLSLFSVNEERNEALGHSPLPEVTASTVASVVRQSLPARAALYRLNFPTH